MIYPSRPLIALLIVTGLCCLVLGVARQFIPAFAPLSFVVILLGVVMATIALFDYWISRGLPYVQVARNVASTLPVGKKQAVTLRLENSRSVDIDLTLYDHLPQSIKFTSDPLQMRVKANSYIDISYDIVPLQRGDAEFTVIDVVAKSRMRFWHLCLTRPLPQKVKIYPDFAAITQLASLVHDQQGAQLGLHVRQRRGEGMEFHQLRDFRQGDSLRRVDWKASSRMRKLITKGYQDERDQEIIFMLDCGRRMHAKDSELSHFDYCLNSLLLMAYVALSKGDRVGFMTFSGANVWCPAKGGSAALPGLIQNTYRLHSTVATSDYLHAAMNLLNRQKKRALIVLLSNFQHEDVQDLKSAMHLLRKKHLVISAGLRESYIDETLARPVDDFDSALAFSGVSQLSVERIKLVNELREMGVHLVDTLAKDLPIRLVNQYLAMKRAGLC